MRTSSPPIRTALIGYGLAGAVFHAPLITESPAFTLSAIVTGDAQRQAQAKARHPDAEIFTSADALFAARACDLVVVATANRAHASLTQAALDARLHVIVEKPFTGDAREAARLTELAHARGLMLSVFHNRRWDGDFLTVQRLLRENALGGVHRFESRFERWRPNIRANWRESADARDVGGVMYDLGSHLVDQALVLFGPGASVYAERHARRAGAAVDDDSFIALTHASGVRSHLWMSMVAAAHAPRFRVLGASAAFEKFGLDPQEEALRAGGKPDRAGWAPEAKELWGAIEAGDALRIVPSEAGDYPAFYAQTARAIRDGAPPPVDPRDVIATLTILEAAAASARSGQTIAL